MNAVVLNGAASERVHLDCKQCDTSFRWIEGEAPSDYAGELCSFADNVKRVLMHGLSWYQLKSHMVISISKISSLASIYWAALTCGVAWTAQTGLYRRGALRFWVDGRAFRSEEAEESLTTEWRGGQSTPFKRWRPFWPHPMACWVSDTLMGT